MRTGLDGSSPVAEHLPLLCWGPDARQSNLGVSSSGLLQTRPPEGTPIVPEGLAHLAVQCPICSYYLSLSAKGTSSPLAF